MEEKYDDDPDLDQQQLFDQLVEKYAGTLAFPAYPEMPTLHQMFADIQLKYGICISGHLTITDDFDLDHALKQSEEFAAFTDKYLHKQVTEFNNVQDGFNDKDLFTFTTNPYRKMNTITVLPRQFLTKPNLDRRHKMGRIPRDQNIQTLCFADGSVNYQKLSSYLRDEKWVKLPSFDVQITLVPLWDIHGLSYMQVLYQLYLKLKQTPFKDEKALFSQFNKDI